MSKPLKRHPSLVPLSKDHHHGLLLCWKLREAQKRKISSKRVKEYLDFFFKTQLKPHFSFEEKEVFPLLGTGHPLVQQAVTEHKRLRFLFSQEDNNEDTIINIEKELKAHIRFEERTLFQKIQEVTSEADLEKLAQKEEKVTTPDPDDWEDHFWLKGN